VTDAEAIIARSRIDPVWFCKYVLRVELEVWQVEMMEAVADLDRIRRGIKTKFNHDGRKRFTIVSCHRSGKTFYICCLMIWFQFTRRGRVPLTAIKEDTITRRTLPTMREIVRGAHPIVAQAITIKFKHAYFFNDQTHDIVGETATNPDALAGFHHANLMFVVDEASSIPDPMFSVISGALAGANAILVMIANPTRTEGFFYASHKDIRTEKYYYRKSIDPFTETTRVSLEWIEEMRIRYGENSPIYKIRALGEFAESSENQLISLDWVNGSRMGDVVPDGGNPRLIVTSDVGGGGVDSSVVIVALEYPAFTHFVKMYSFNFPGATAVADLREALTHVWEEHNGDPLNGDYFVIDSIGIGDGVSAELVKAQYPVIRYKGGSQSDDTEVWRNRRVQSYLCLRDALRDGRVRFDPNFCDEGQWLELEAQIVSIRAEPGTEKWEDIELKSRMLARGIKSPDIPDAMSMVYATQEPHNSGGSADIELIGELESFHEEF